MKPIINVDSRGAGEGKTTTGIYKSLKIAKRLIKVPTLLVVPSIKLQTQYQTGIPDILRKDDVINSDTTDNVSAALLQRMMTPYDSSGTPTTICITHEAFRRTEIPRTLRADWNLVLDEAIDPWSYEKINLKSTKSWQPNFNFANLFYWAKPTTVVAGDAEVFHEIKMGTVPDNMLFSDSPQWQRLVSLNHRLWIKEPAYQRLCQRDEGYSELIISLNQTIFEDWRYVNIAAAAFEYTFLFHWFKIAGFEVHIEKPFVKQSKNIKIHTMALPDGLKWSNRKRTQYPEILDDYHSYVNRVIKRPILAVRNNAETRRLVDEIRLGHNAHGQNDYTHYTAISLETALIANPTLQEFYTKQIGLSDEQIVTAFSAYVFYQLVMRTALRLKDNTEQVDIAILDYQTLIELANFLEWPVDNTTQDIKTSYLPPAKPIGRPRGSKGKTKAMTSAERKRKWRENQIRQANELFELVKEDIDKT